MVVENGHVCRTKIYGKAVMHNDFRLTARKTVHIISQETLLQMSLINVKRELTERRNIVSRIYIYCSALEPRNVHLYRINFS